MNILRLSVLAFNPRNVFMCTTLLLAGAVAAQQKEGRVVYQRTMELNITIQGDAALSSQLPKTNVSNYELNFAGNRASWKQIQELQQEEPGAGGMIMRFGGADDLNWFDLENARRLQQTEFAGKNYLISDSIRNGNWKLTDETKTILGHNCRKAISTVTSRRLITMMENGSMQRKEISDTSLSTAWFTTDIPVSVGPEVQGQLPGLVLEMSTRSGKVVYVATEIQPKADPSALKEPTKGKKITAPEFAKERLKMMEQMQGPGNGGGMRVTFSAQ